ncbi:MAG TPA: hypothetical protein VF517_05400 [Thermoleophilaceae bacterium]|jgi:hypothetical protein
MRLLGLVAMATAAAVALPASAAAQRVPERVPFDPIASTAFGGDSVCTGHQTVTWSRPSGQWVGTLTAQLYCPARMRSVSGECGLGLVARDNVTLAVRSISRNVGGIYVANRIPGTCEPAPIDFDPANPPGETLLGRFDASFYASNGGLAGPTVFCQDKSGDYNRCENDIRFEPGEDLTILYR